ncbi:hypothetical protein [Candidatus Thiodictyon syntrophicum]|jgi:hypothetical protein|uniref:Uncharacterized protein n=1 Tax=Candidatus Thiodictyon syntrophicum TaxID=1166950 RepID=A0A2K8UF81_9GAMM|nr:hypothetical protein [Candidatus Thiodictyon syntrophicum]AUB83761.1 hypothetical protein THSYN_24265 [Candidatus Thiodictyon syntrophicum]
MSYLERLRATEKKSESPGWGTAKTDKTPLNATFGGFGGTPSGPFRKIEGLPEAPRQATPLPAADPAGPAPAPRPVQRAYRVLVRMAPHDPARWITLVTVATDLGSVFAEANEQFGPACVLALDC